MSYAFVEVRKAVVAAAVAAVGTLGAAFADGHVDKAEVGVAVAAAVAAGLAVFGVKNGVAEGKPSNDGEGIG